jgi:DNA primase
LGRAVGQSDIDAVRESTDLIRLIGEHIALKPRGREHVGVCPFHDDHSPSMAVVTHKGNAFYKCHACGAGGDAFDFVMNYHKMEFGEALRLLADRAGIKLQPRPSEAATESGPGRADLRKVNSFAASFYDRALRDEAQGAVGRAMIQQRGISAEMVQAFGLGMAPDSWDALAGLVARRGLPESAFVAAGLLKHRTNGAGLYDSFRNRLIFPICDELGQPIAFGARKLNPDDEPKYLNSAESSVFSKSRTLFGLHLAKRAIMDSRQVIVTEGYTDVIACHQAGITNVVGTLGTALTREHAKVLSRLCDTVVMLFDGDDAGQKAADRAISVFFSEPVDVRICVLPDNLDPDELLKQDDGAERFVAATANSIDALAFKFRRFQQKIAPSTGISARQKLLESFLAELGELGFAAMQGVRKR